MTIAQMLYSFRLWRIIIYFYHHPCLENKNKAVCIGKNRECRNRVFYSSGAGPRDFAPHPTKIVVNCLQSAKEWGVGRVCLGATEQGRSLYEKLGFKALNDEMQLDFWLKCLKRKSVSRLLGGTLFFFYLFQQVLVRILGPLTLLQVNSTNQLLQF